MTSQGAYAGMRASSGRSRLAPAIYAVAVVMLSFLTLLASLLLPSYALASEGGGAGESDESGIVLAVYNLHQGFVGSGCRVELHRIGSIGSDGSLIPEESFKAYNVRWDVSDSSSLRALADTLEGYIVRDDIEPTDVGTTDANGVIVFPYTLNELDEGYYLVIIERMVTETEVYVSLPALLPLTKDGGRQGITPKSEVYSLTDVAKIEAVKIWEGGDPVVDQVVAQLLRDGEVVDEVVLSEANGWRHAWENLSVVHQWDVVEKIVPDGCLVRVLRSDFDHSIVNTIIDQPTPPTPPENEGTPPKLPQTGVLWWPVPVLFAIGILCLGVGFTRARRS
ncbi:MAG: hypothetical protein IKV48_06100 [Eggerthellaceae bacterium]|nr:hypothetical protein [Eggerthellaceae bacterium]